MSICIKTEDGRVIEFDGTDASIGSDEACVIAFPGDDRLSFQHARLSKILFQWRIDTLVGAQLSVNDRHRGTGAFLQSNDCISLSPAGPMITFRPSNPDPEDDGIQVETSDAAAELLVAADSKAEPPAAADHVALDSQPAATSEPEPITTFPDESQVQAALPIAQVVTAASSEIPNATIKDAPMVAIPVDTATAILTAPATSASPNTASEPWEVANEAAPRRPRRDASPVSMMISAALGGLTVFGIYKLLSAFGMM